MPIDKHELGKRLIQLRVDAGYSQREVGELLGVTDKAVSKWENGATYPGMESLLKLADLYHLSLDELLEADGPAGPLVRMIVVTGGPCAGKTTAMSWLSSELDKKGWRVLFVPETATELIGGGVAPWTCRSNRDYQAHQFELQLAKERVFLAAAHAMDAEKVLVVCDRGLLDNKAYMTERDFADVLRGAGLTEVAARDRYDAVFHLVTAAKGAREFYTLSNNAARTETPDEAAALDDRLISAWTGHEHFRIIENAGSFEDKMMRFLGAVTGFLGEPEPCEVERKFLIERPDEARLLAMPACRKVDILQTYLHSEPGVEVRLRQRGEAGDYAYYKTTKRPVSQMTSTPVGEASSSVASADKDMAPLARIELEERLTQGQYLRLLMDADPACAPVRKTRYCLTYEGRYLEVDVFPFWEDKAILEVELADEAQVVDPATAFPHFLQVIREVTDDPAYTNHEIAKGLAEGKVWA